MQRSHTVTPVGVHHDICGYTRLSVWDLHPHMPGSALSVPWELSHPLLSSSRWLTSSASWQARVLNENCPGSNRRFDTTWISSFLVRKAYISLTRARCHLASVWLLRLKPEMPSSADETSVRDAALLNLNSQLLSPAVALWSCCCSHIYIMPVQTLTAPSSAAPCDIRFSFFTGFSCMF